MKNFILSTLFFTLGIYTHNYTTIYKISCNTEKFGYMWISEEQLYNVPFECLNSKHILQIEKDPYMIYKINKNRIIALFSDLGIK